MAAVSAVEVDKFKLDELIAEGSLDFEDWTKLISYIEQIHRDEVDKITVVYDSFLSVFPLCYGYWKKYAEHKARLCGVEKAVEIFERAVESVPYSVGVWVDYCIFSVSSFEDPLENCRLFERGLSFVGKDYLCHKLWDKYIEYEYSQQHWTSLANIYVQTLKFPTKKLHQYYQSFKKLVAIWEERGCQSNSSEEVEAQDELDCDTKASKDTEISCAINGLLDPFTRSKALRKYISIAEQFYQRACDLDVKVRQFEQNIHRPYFHVKPLNDNQLQNWHRYLDLVEMEGDFDWTVKLYERCLISCANYPEFWMRYVDYVESKGGKEIATDALERATNTFLKNAPEFHLFNAWYKEKEGDLEGVRAAFLRCNEESDSHFIDIVSRQANVEKRLGNYVAASDTYKEALKLASKKRPQTLPLLYVHFARYVYTTSKNVEATGEVLLDGIQHVPHSKLVLKELVLFALMHEGAIQVDVLDPIVEKALALASDASGGLSIEDREELSRLYLEFIDFHGSIHNVWKAWKRHVKLFPHLVRPQSSVKKSAKAGDIWKMLTGGKIGSVISHSQELSGEHNENDDFVHRPTPEEKLLTGEESAKTELAECGAIESTDQAANDQPEVVKDCKSVDIQQEGEQSSQQQKPPSLDDEFQDMDVPVSPRLEAPREASLSNASTPPSVHDIDETPSISCPASPRNDDVAKRYHESSGPSSKLSHKNGLPAISADHPSDRNRNRCRLNPPSKERLESTSPRDSEDRLERSLSPRRRGTREHSHDRRHRERSLSPRGHSSRRYSEDRWHRDRQSHRYNRNQDNLRGRRDGRMQKQNQNQNQNQASNAQQQIASQAQLPVQPIAYPQAQMNQYPPPTTDQYGNVQNNQMYNHMWQYYYYNQQQQQQLLQQQQPPGQQQQLQPPTLNQQVQKLQQAQQISPQQQQLLLQYHQQQFYQQQLQQQNQLQQPSDQLQVQQQLNLQQQPQLAQPQQLHHQMQIQQQEQLQQQAQPKVQNETVNLQQQQQQAYHYQELQKQQYLLYLQQLQLYQQSQQQSGLLEGQQSLQHQQKLPGKQGDQEKLPKLQCGDEKSQHQQDDSSSQAPLAESIPHSTFGAHALGQSQDELPEIEGTDG